MPVDPRVKPLVPMHDRFTSEREMLAHARNEADRLGLDDYFVVDVDSHRDPSSVWPAVLRYMENPVMRFNSQHDLEVMGVAQYVPTPGGRGFQFQAMHGRIPHQELSRAVPARDGCDEHRRPGRIPDLAAVARDVADADR
jgi:hypothetical protein